MSLAYSKRTVLSHSDYLKLKFSDFIEKPKRNMLEKNNVQRMRSARNNITLILAAFLFKSGELPSKFCQDNPGNVDKRMTSCAVS